MQLLDLPFPPFRGIPTDPGAIFAFSAASIFPLGFFIIVSVYRDEDG